MADSPIDSDYPSKLRVMAEGLLKQGIARASHGHFCSVEALSVLYRMASSPDNAADGLKMLHELQTLQIELDLQRDQYEANVTDADAELLRYRDLYEHAPVGYLVISLDGSITESNQASTKLLGYPSAELDGHLLEQFLAEESRVLWSWRMKKLRKGSPMETCALRAEATQVILDVFATLAPDGDMVLMNISTQAVIVDR
jgi:PAS domain S-box-containing protein